MLEADKDHWIHTDERLEDVFSDDPSEPYFGHQMERSWMMIFQCADDKLAQTCSRLGDRKGKTAGKALDSCQCLDAKPKGNKSAAEKGGKKAKTKRAALRRKQRS
jgi:hypothetical protein